ncbi:hypothetical protein Tco_1513497 [Tanacetum coccineum]
MWLVRHLVVQVLHLWLQGLMIWKVDDLVNEDYYSEVEEESHGEDLYDDDDFDDPGLTIAHMKFTNAFDINLRVQLR